MNKEVNDQTEAAPVPEEASAPVGKPRRVRQSPEDRRKALMEEDKKRRAASDGVDWDAYPLKEPR